jgi:nucleotide-binding universal stress UspA family protein
MKTILFPTDFSKNANHAMQFAVDLCVRTGARLIILNSYELPYSDTVMSTSLIEVMKKNSEQELEDIVKVLEASHPDLDVSTVSTMNNPIRAIKNQAMKFEADLIVMGTKGASGLQEVLIGSNTASVMSSNICPVLAVPRDAELKHIKKAVYFMDQFKKEDCDALEFVREFLKKFNAKLQVIHFQERHAEDSPIPQNIKEICSGVDCNIEQIETDSIDESISEFLDAKKDIDMIIMMKRKYTFLDRLFHRSRTTQAAYHAKVPFLSIHE